jgi:hypothetical protein
MIHECLDFILEPLKRSAEIGTMTSDPAGSVRHVFTPLAAYMVDVPEALSLAAGAGNNSHLTVATYKQFGDPFRHEPRTPSTTLVRLHALEETLNLRDLFSYVYAHASEDASQLMALDTDLSGSIVLGQLEPN